MAIVLNGTTGITAPALDALDIELNNVNVVERGSNANGDFVRFADGTQICHRKITFNVSIITAAGGGFRSAVTVTDLAAAFMSSSFEVTGFVIGTNVDCMLFTIASTATNQVSWTVWRAASGGSGAGEILSIIAIGRWF